MDILDHAISPWDLLHGITPANPYNSKTPPPSPPQSPRPHHHVLAPEYYQRLLEISECYVLIVMYDIVYKTNNFVFSVVLNL